MTPCGILEGMGRRPNFYNKLKPSPFFRRMTPRGILEGMGRKLNFFDKLKPSPGGTYETYYQ